VGWPEREQERRVGRDDHVGAVDERLLDAAPDGRGAVRALAPRVARSVLPLDDALAASQAGREADLVAERDLLGRVFRDDEPRGVGVGQEQWVS
jgi:hypothetical protein